MFNLNETTIRLMSMAQGLTALCLCSIVLTVSVPAHAQSNDVLNRLGRLENEIDTLNRAVYKGEVPPPGAVYSGPAGAAGPSGNVEIRLQQLEDDLRGLTGQMEEQSFAVQQLRMQMERMDRESQMRTMDTQQQVPQQPPQPVYNSTQPAAPAAGQQIDQIDYNYNPPQPGMKTVTMTQPQVDSSDPAAAYEQAFSLIKAGDYDGAEVGFDSFLKNHPDHVLASNAKYWLGETFYVRHQYDKAARVFAEAYQKYPDGPKAADNLLKLGMSLGGLGKKEDACVALAQIAIEYPNGPAPVMDRAKQEMNTLGCP